MVSARKLIFSHDYVLSRYSFYDDYTMRVEPLDAALHVAVPLETEWKVEDGRVARLDEGVWRFCKEEVQRKYNAYLAALVVGAPDGEDFTAGAPDRQ